MLSRYFHFGVFEIFVSSLFLLVVLAFGEYWLSIHYNLKADSQEEDNEWVQSQNLPCFFFSKTVICYLLFVTQKFIYGNCQLSTVTPGIDDIDLSCDMMKNKPQKIWNISLLFVYLQRTMVQIQKLIFHILKDF